MITWYHWCNLIKPIPIAKVSLHWKWRASIQCMILLFCSCTFYANWAQNCVHFMKASKCRSTEQKYTPLRMFYPFHICLNQYCSQEKESSTSPHAGDKILKLLNLIDPRVIYSSSLCTVSLFARLVSLVSTAMFKSASVPLVALRINPDFIILKVWLDGMLWTSLCVPESMISSTTYNRNEFLTPADQCF